MARIARHSILIVSVACVAFFTNLGATHLWDEDEGFFAGAASEMFARQDWVVPHYNGRMFSHKPPFMYWMMMLGFQTFGVTPFAARLGSAIFSVGTALLTYFIGKRLFSTSVGLLAALIVCSSLMFDLVARAATPDSYLVFFMTLTLYLFICRRRGEVSPPGPNVTALAASGMETSRFPPRRIAVAMYAAMGMAVLVKGPVGVLLPMAAIGLYLLCTTPLNSLPAHANWHQRWLNHLRPFGPVNFLRCLWSMKPITAVAVVMLTAGPWFAWVGYQTQGQFLTQFFGVHNFGRFLHSMESHHGSILYYPVAVLIGFFPWSIFAGITVIELVQSIRSRDTWSDAYVLLSCWIVVIIAFFTLAGTKLPNYVLPVYPALALLTACTLQRWINTPQTVPTWQPRVCYGVLGFVGAVLLIGLPLASTLQLRGEPLVAALGAMPALAKDLPWMGLLGIFPLVGAGVALWLHERGGQLSSIVVMVVGAFLLVVGALDFAAVRIDRYQYTERLANRIIEASGGRPAKVSHYRNSRPTLIFYLRQPVDVFWNPEALPSFFADNQNAFLVTNSQVFSDLQANLPADVSVLAEEDQFPRRGKVLLLGRSIRVGDSSENLKR
jgi:4-amino-4-deoxy-L-arabinose transferase-like glycosyltransferase